MPVGRVAITEPASSASCRHSVVQRRRARRNRVDRIRDSRQNVVTDLDRRSCVARRAQRLGNHRGERLADRAHLVDRERPLRRVERRPRRVRPEGFLLVVDDIGRHRKLANASQIRRPIVRAGQHREHARHRARCCRVDAADHGMRVRRAHERGVRLARQTDIVGIAARAGHEPRVLKARQRASDIGMVRPPFRHF